MKKFLTLLLLSAQMATAHAQGWYVNPVINQSLPDPTIIRVGQDFYLYATENIRNTPIYTSRDLVHWNFTGTCFTDETRPQMVPRGRIWAPDINRIGDRYVLYYSKSEWGGEWECGIGAATAEQPQGPFTDVGKLFISNEIGVQNSIDPFYIEDHGRKYLFWGSFRGIYGIELADDGLSVRQGAEKVQIAGTHTEGTYIHYRDGYYYLIGSAGTCCEGERSTYHLVVARAKNVFGPYLDRKGGSAMQNHFEMLLHRSDLVVGPGHCSEIVQDDAGQDWILYHGFDAKDIDGGRKVYLDRVQWDAEGWPFINGQVPSANAAAPQFGENAGR
ncbi:MAG: family 43 glycosylhydrolase [Bacteroidaceae bacterium]|nr:family 43 glycosylhydrolase [Bacteroidaceae bacterium]